MRRVFIFLFFSSFILFTSCSDQIPEWKAASAARDYYELLAQGDAVRFLEHKAGIDTLAADYGEQLLAAVRQYQRDIQQKHGGLQQVRVSDEHYVHDGEQCRDTTLQTTYAFLILCYADSTEEEVMVPMVERDGEWLMK